MRWQMLKMSALLSYSNGGVLSLLLSCRHQSREEIAHWRPADNVYLFIDMLSLNQMSSIARGIFDGVSFLRLCCAA